MAEEIINKIALSGIQTIDLAKFYPKEDVVELDIKDFLFMGMILKEKDFRQKLTATDWNIYGQKVVCIYCSVDTLVPHWAYMLFQTYLSSIAKEVYVGRKSAWIEQDFLKNLHEEIQPENFDDIRVVIKGCGDLEIPASGYLEITKILMPVAKSIMYGEPCSTVPVFKRK